MSALTSLIVNKRRLPAILQNDVPLLRIRKPVQSLVMVPARLWGVLHRSIGKQILYCGLKATIANVHHELRQLEADGNRFWVPRRAGNRKQMRKERLRRQYSSGIRVAFSGLHYTGQARPDADSVPVENIYREIPVEVRRFLRSLGRPENCLTSTGSRETKLMSLFIRADNLKRMLRQQLNLKTKEFVENLVVEHLRRSQMSEQRISATYDVLVGGEALASVAKQRGLHEGNLRQIVNRVSRAVRPALEAQLNVWAGNDDVQKTVAEVGILEAEKVLLINQTTAQIASERVASLR